MRTNLPPRPQGRWIAVAVIAATVPAIACALSTGAPIPTAAPLTPTQVTQSAAPSASEAVPQAPPATLGAPETPSGGPASLQFRDVNTWKDPLTGDLNFLGLIVNTGSTDASLIRPAVTLRDAQHNVVASQSSDITFCLDDLPAGESQPFWLRVSDVPTWTDYELTVQAEAPAFASPAYLALEATTIQGRPGQFGSYRMIGELRNPGTIDAHFVRLTAILYDPQGKILAAQCGLPTSTDISAGASSPFDIEIVLLPQGADVARYSVTARGLPK